MPGAHNSISVFAIECFLVMDDTTVYFGTHVDRQQELNVQQHETLSELEDFSENAHSSILYILLEILGVKDEDMSYAASHVGVCSGIATQLRGMAPMASQVSSQQKCQYFVTFTRN